MQKVVIADDNEVILKQMENYLAQCDEIKVVGIARNGQEELECIKHIKPDLVVTDLEMPIKTGVDVIEEIVRSALESPPEFIVVTGGTNSEVMQRLYKLPVKRIFRKPLNMQELVAEILQEQNKEEIQDGRIAKNPKEIKKKNLFQKVFRTKS